MKKFFQAWQHALQYLNDASSPDDIVFYSEGHGYAPYLRPVIDALAGLHDGIVIYLTSDIDDRILQHTPPHVRAYYIGKGAACTHTLNHMRANVAVMTMPDMNTFHIKRSPKVRHYAYLHHSMVSTHMVYRKGAFDHFDSILCVGPHHVSEIREWEALLGLSAKQLFHHGHPPLDNLIKATKERPPPPIADDKRLNILLAPSWGPQGLMETRAEECTQILLDAGHFVRVRPHPRTRQISRPILDALADRFARHPGFDMNEDTTRYDALFQSHVMISDWSGVAMEFAFGTERPVLFVDVPRKINNPEYSTLSSQPLETTYREEAGAIISPDQLNELPAALLSLLDHASLFQERMRAFRARHIFHVGTSALQGAKIIVELASNLRSQA